MKSPTISGAAIKIDFLPNLTSWRGKLLSGDPRGEAIHGTSFLRERRIVLDTELVNDWQELSRILVHELFHFVWVRLGNPRRHSYQQLLHQEITGNARGELGWSSQWRKDSLKREDPLLRSRKWREYTAESFCDTAAYFYSNCGLHEEYTLSKRYRLKRSVWFEENAAAKLLRF